MSGHGGDVDLDVVGILQRAQQPGDLAEVRRAIEDLRNDSKTEWIAELLQDARLQIAELVAAVQALAERTDSSADHLCDTTGMDSFTQDLLLESPRSWHLVGPPNAAAFFHAKAISAVVCDPADRAVERFATLQRAAINEQPLLVGEIPLERWKAPPGRGHPVDWVFSLPCLVQPLTLDVVSHQSTTTLLRLTVCGDPYTSLPPRWHCGLSPQGGEYTGR